MTTQTKVWDRDAVHQLLEQNHAALARAVLTIYARQTADEKNSRATTDANGRGFSGHDAAFPSDIAQKLPRYEHRMMPAQRARALPKMKRYWRQLLEEIEAKGGQVSYGVAKCGAISLNRSKEIAETVDVEVAAAIAAVRSRPTRGELARDFGA